MPSTILKRKKKENENSTSFQSAKRITRSSTFLERTLFELTNKVENSSTSVDDKNVINTFRRHSIGNVNVATLQSFSKFSDIGW